MGDTTPVRVFRILWTSLLSYCEEGVVFERAHAACCPGVVRLVCTWRFAPFMLILVILAVMQRTAADISRPRNSEIGT